MEIHLKTRRTGRGATNRFCASFALMVHFSDTPHESFFLKRSVRSVLPIVEYGILREGLRVSGAFRASGLLCRDIVRNCTVQFIQPAPTYRSATP